MISKGGHGALNRMPLPALDKANVNLEPLGGPRFLITVDTEEEFDWNGPFSRDRHGTTHIPAIRRFQTMCEQHGIVPVYLVDYPIADDAAAVELLGGFANTGNAEIGVQLHPWVNPPFVETVNTFNSFACNLSADIEREKLTVLHQKIVERFGVRPDIYRAGRYGAGESTPDILQDLGIAIDTSVRSRFNYSAQGGPDYSDFPVNPYWLIPDRLIELPLTTVYAGRLRKVGNTVFQRMFSSDPSRSILSRTGMLERVALTPEGIPLDRALAGIDSALQEGVGILNFSFHSPSLAAGNTSYTRNCQDLESFYEWWQTVFAYFTLHNVQPISVSEIKRHLVT
jgi:hypothetical protein